ncbi:Uncharacterised protein [Mycoplasmopsis synoviae]|uniref:Uncharacterized protein n=1 Tax=Mycoplasmopsis synoviae TaxID=2109 RepID=A0A3B0PVJ3_MYCSY|nr:Uncharacterised protein [Mycoplasmopsis synoviae]
MVWKCATKILQASLIADSGVTPNLVSSSSSSCSSIFKEAVFNSVTFQATFTTGENTESMAMKAPFDKLDNSFSSFSFSSINFLLSSKST